MLKESIGKFPIDHHYLAITDASFQPAISCPTALTRRFQWLRARALPARSLQVPRHLNGCAVFANAVATDDVPDRYIDLPEDPIPISGQCRSTFSSCATLPVAAARN
jgi:hypothetical protein